MDTRVAFKDLLDRTPSPPPSPGWVVVLALLYLLPGTFQHDPWKTEDAIHIAIAHGIFSGSNPWAPAIAGEAWPHTPPLFHWFAAACAGILAPFLPFHAGARLATTLFALILLFALAQTARRFYDETAARLAPLLGLVTLALVEWLHEAQPAIAGLACAALAWWGAGLVANGAFWRGAIWIGLGNALAFASYGLAGLAMAAPPLLAPLFYRQGRAFLLAFALAASAIAAFWKLGQHYAPGWWSAWWANEWAEATRARQLPSSRHLAQFLWLSWPLLPFALWTLWQRPHRRLDFSLALPLIGAALALLWYGSGSPRTLSFLPAILPLALLASASCHRLRRGAANAFDWFAWVTFTFIALLVWLGASAQGLGWPAGIARNFAKLAPGHVADYSWLVVAFAAALTLAWFALVRLPRTPWRPVLRWCAGMTLMWGLVVALWLPWIDHYKSYRPVVLALAQTLPQDAGCITREGLSSAHRAVLDYFAGIRTVVGVKGESCAFRIVLASPGFQPPEGWQLRWSGGRPSDRKERWYLLERKVEKEAFTASESSSGST